MASEQHCVSPENAPQVWEWLQTRGGLNIWDCVDLSDAGKTWTCPVNDASGKPLGKQHYAMGKVIRTITDPAEVVVIVPKEYRRFRVAVRPASNNPFCTKLTDASSHKLRDAVAKATEKCSKWGHGAWHEFDYSTQEAVILVPDKVIPLAEFMEGKHENGSE